MGIRLVESIKLSCSGANPRWDLARDAAVLFDGEFFAVSCQPADCQPDGPHFDLDWSTSTSKSLLPLADWYGISELELIEALGDTACDGYIAEPAA
jgi:hypothetical protein